MSNIELVIKIPEDIYKEWKLAGKYYSYSYAQRLILNGTPLPKGHGRLIDADALRENCLWWETEKEVSLAPTIIEAEKESE